MANEQKTPPEDLGELIEEGKAKLAETFKKVLSTGASAAFMTEEGIRTYLSDLKLPKDVLNMLIQSANKTKDEIASKVSREMLGILSKIDFVKESTKFIEEHKFKITAEIEVTKKS